MGVQYENSTFVAVGRGGIILTSADGEPHGLQGLLTHQKISMTSPMETVNSLPWVFMEPQ